MTRLAYWLLMGILWPIGNLCGQTIAELEAQLQKETALEKQAQLNYQLAEYCLLGDPSKSNTYAEKAAQLAEKQGNFPLLAKSNFLAGETHFKLGRLAPAANAYKRAYELSLRDSLPDITLRSLEHLKEIAQKQGKPNDVIRWAEALVAFYKDRSAQEHNLQRAYKEKMEEALAESKRYNKRVIPSLLGGFIIFFLYVLYRHQRSKRRIKGELAEKNAMIEEKRRRSEHLLLNILPRAVAAELSFQNQVKARRYDKATVMFVDFVKFTQVAEQFSPEALVEELHQCFSAFDNLIGKARVEKIKTVGDAYICASGLSDRNERPNDMIELAQRIQVFLQKRREERAQKGLPFFEARIGIHIGPVVAGVVGLKKFAYDIWGDTVNIAARLEETCETDQINVSREVRDAAGELFAYEFRGKIASKNKADIEMYYVV